MSHSGYNAHLPNATSSKYIAWRTAMVKSLYGTKDKTRHGDITDTHCTTQFTSQPNTVTVTTHEMPCMKADVSQTSMLPPSTSTLPSGHVIKIHALDARFFDICTMYKIAVSLYEACQLLDSPGPMVAHAWIDILNLDHVRAHMDSLRDTPESRRVLAAAFQLDWCALHEFGKHWVMSTHDMTYRNEIVQELLEYPICQVIFASLRDLADGDQRSLYLKRFMHTEHIVRDLLEMLGTQCLIHVTYDDT